MFITTLLLIAMRLKALLTDDDSAVSPVIGVILMVAITVILAAVIASFVLGLGPSETAPTVNFDSEYDTSAGGGSGVLTIEVVGGDTVPADKLSIAGDVNSTTDGTTFNNLNSEPFGASSQISSGDSVTVNADTDDYSISVVWTSDDGSSSSTLTTFESA